MCVHTCICLTLVETCVPTLRKPPTRLPHTTTAIVGIKEEKKNSRTLSSLPSPLQGAQKKNLTLAFLPQNPALVCFAVDFFIWRGLFHVSLLAEKQCIWSTYNISPFIYNVVFSCCLQTRWSNSTALCTDQSTLLWRIMRLEDWQPIKRLTAKLKANNVFCVLDWCCHDNTQLRNSWCVLLVRNLNNRQRSGTGWNILNWLRLHIQYSVCS